MRSERWRVRVEIDWRWKVRVEIDWRWRVRVEIGLERWRLISDGWKIIFSLLFIQILKLWF